METLELNKHEARDKLLAKSSHSHDSEVRLALASEDDDGHGFLEGSHNDSHDNYNRNCTHDMVSW